MSLVAYASSSGDESDENDETFPINTKPSTCGHISDEEDVPIIAEPEPFKSSLNLPLPKSVSDTDTIQALFGKLPEPKIKESDLIEEEDDEFLHKKAIPLETPKPCPPTKNLVRITIPSLKDFDDVEEKKEKPNNIPAKHSSFSSLISMLPTPKSEQNFVKAKPHTNDAESKQLPKPMAFVPDVVKNRRPAQNTENVEKTITSEKPKRAPKPKSKVSLVSVSDSDGSDNESSDYFSLTNDFRLPEVSKDEIEAMVSKKAAEMAKSSSKFLETNEADMPQQEQEPETDNSAYSTNNTLDKEAIQVLIGSQAKRRKVNDIQVIDISGDQVQPNKEEWMRNALASATTYQPTGVLTDEEPAQGTRRKHQITYLAHKAKANEAELQAMWSANRQNRRQTQNKYGF